MLSGLFCVTSPYEEEILTITEQEKLNGLRFAPYFGKLTLPSSAFESLEVLANVFAIFEIVEYNGFTLRTVMWFHVDDLSEQGMDAVSTRPVRSCATSPEAPCLECCPKFRLAHPGRSSL